MGWSFRKSFNVGPVRINISKSGIGYSIGTKGFRIGNGPRGRYLRMGTHGIYYYQSLNEPKNSQSKNEEHQEDQLDNIEHQNKPNFIESNMKENNSTSADTANLEFPVSESCIGFLEKVASHTQFLADLEAKYKEQQGIAKGRRESIKMELINKKMALSNKYWKDNWFFFFIPFLISCIIFPLFPIMYIIYTGIEDKTIGKKVKKLEETYQSKIDLLTSQENQLTKKYEAILQVHKKPKFDFPEEQIFHLEKFRSLFNSTPTIGEMVLMVPQTHSHNIINDEFCVYRTIKFSENNLGQYLCQTVPCMTAGERILYFFPQGLLIQKNHAHFNESSEITYQNIEDFSELSYQYLTVKMFKEHLIVTKRPRKDAVIEGDSWEHSRVDGTPDRRFKENAHYFIVRYYGVLLQYKSLFVKPFYFSNPESAKVFCEEFNKVLQNIPQYPRLS